MTINKPTITVETTVKATVENVWKLWTTPANIIQFNNPLTDWHTPKVEIDLREGGNFFYRMEAKDGSFGFDFSGQYNKIIPYQLIECAGADGRKTINQFKFNGNETTVSEIFEPDAETPLEVQRAFVQTILDNFKKYVENKE